MTSLVRINESGTAVRRLRALAVLVPLTLVWAVATTAEPAAASRWDATFKEPKLQHGMLSVKGTRADDRIALRLQAGNAGVLQVDVGDDGSADFTVERASIQRIVVTTRGGDDRVRIDDANGTFTDAVPTTIDGGVGDDTLAGGGGAETLRGSVGNDSIDGNRGNDVAFMGVGDDTFVWDPGDGSDVVEGQVGDDTMLFNGAGGAERVDLSANGDRLRFFREPAAITMDTDSVERVVFNALGGADVVTVNDLSGTDVRYVDIDQGTPDGQTDQVVVNGTDRDDEIEVDGGQGNVTVSGLRAQVAILRAEPTDQLLVNGLGADDEIDASGLAAVAIALTLDGGADDDFIVGSAGNDMLFGRDGDDVLLGGPGQDVLDGGAGDNVVIQG
jgi:Ca2+-binding RTX toxin-like protein